MNTLGLLNTDVTERKMDKVGKLSLYINDLDQFLRDNNSGSIELVQTHLRLLLFADDLVLLAPSPSELQSSINLLDNYCKGSKLSINLEKTKIVIFNNTRNLQHTHFNLNGHPIEIAKKLQIPWHCLI